VAKRRGRYPKGFRMAVERLKSCDNIVALAQELGVHRRLLYKWRDQLEPGEHGEAAPSTPELRQQVRQLKRLRAGKAMEVDSRLDASGAAALASRHLRPNPGSDVAARQLKHRAHVSVSASESGGFPSCPTGAKFGRERDGSAVSNSADRHATSPPLRLSADLGGAAATGMVVNHKRVARIMREDNLLAVQPRQFVVTTDSDHQLEVYLQPGQSNEVDGDRSARGS
jgi:transposase-like protein